MPHPSQTGPIEKRWDFLKNERYDAKLVSIREKIHVEPDIEMHDHPSLTHPGFRFEIAYVKSGEALAFTETSSFSVKPGDYIMIDASLRHGYKVISESPFHIINISFERNAIGHITPHLKTFAEIAKHYLIINELTSSKPIDDLLLHDDDGSVYKMIEAMKKEYEEKLPGYQGIVKAELTKIVLSGLRKYFCKTVQVTYSLAVKKIIDYMEYGYMSNITLSNFSKELKIPLKNLCVQFKSEVGITYTEYVHRRRITESCDLLSNTNEGIEFVSNIVGYSDIKKFRKKFKDFTGMTPREYRGMHHQKN